MASKPVTIIGGGLAGLTLGIALRQHDVPVTVIESGSYPRHRVCGEFIHGQGLRALACLGLTRSLLNAGAISARTAWFATAAHCSPVRPLSEPALCLSRFALDALLASTLENHGGHLQQNHRWHGNGASEGLVLASGRRPHPVENGRRWFGVKVHARNVAIQADLEMHFFRDGYVGICRLKDGEVNICGLFRRHSRVTTPFTGHDELRGEPPSFLHSKLAGAQFIESSFCSIAGLRLRSERAADHLECCIGDSVTMTPPVTGNGMSMAFESAELAAAPLVAYSRGELTWEKARQTIADKLDRAFAQRLRWAAWLHWLMFSPLLQSPLAAVALGSDHFWNWLFFKTRAWQVNAPMHP